MTEFNPAVTRRSAWSKIPAIAAREYKSTALTWAFLLGAVLFPVVIWVAIIGVTASGVLTQEKAPLRGTVAVYDTTESGVVARGLPMLFDPEAQRAERERRREQVRAELERMAEGNPMLERQLEQNRALIERTVSAGAGLEKIADVDFEVLASAEEFERARARLGTGELRALIRVTPETLELPTPRRVGDAAGDAGDTEGEDGDDPDAEPDPAGGAGGAEDDAGGAGEPAPSVYTFLHPKDLDFDYIDDLNRAVRRLVQNHRFESRGIDPATVRLVSRNPPRSQTRQVSAEGEELETNEGLRRFLPFVFMMLLFASAITGGQYLLMSTLEEKGSRVMEVLLSAASPMQLLVGKLIGQGLVGITVLAIYSGLGVAAADRFNILAQVPMDVLPWLVLYFLMAYAFFGALNIAVGSAVTEIREAQALYAPITASIILPFVVMIPIMENPGSLVARIFSFVPPTTPFVMVMRLSDPAHEVPAWELLLSLLVGFGGVLVAVWAAAKIFRIGVLMYGKPPSLLTLMKWLRQA